MPSSGLQNVSVRVPGSTSNIGPGFDCLGIALQLYNEVHLERGSEIGETLWPDHPMVAETAKAFFEEGQVDPFPFTWSIKGDVPMSRGLGSSVTLRHGILHGLNVLCGEVLDRQGLFKLGTVLEGHPDNASAGAFGGFTCSNVAGQCAHFPVEEQLKFLLLIPERELLTDASRQTLPNELPRKQAVESLGNACLITAAFASQRYEWLRGSFTDHLHQPYRAAANPGLIEVIAAAEARGALGGFLSGSGSTIACVALGDEETIQSIGRAMQHAYDVIGNARLLIVSADNEGAVTIPGDE